MSEEFPAGMDIEIVYPFVREKYTVRDNDGSHEIDSWKPGVRAEQCAPDDFEDVADGEGFQIVTVVSTHKPGKYPERVFFTRRWVDPDHKSFGKAGKLRILSVGPFRQLIRGYRHSYIVAEQKAEAA